MSAFQNFSFGENDANIGSKSKPFKAEAGRTYRISFIWWKGLDSGELDMTTKDKDGNPPAPLFVGAPTHFIPNVGYIINKGAEYTKLAGESPRTRVASIMVVWPTDKDGKPDKTRLTNPAAIEVLYWIFSGEKYKALQRIHEEFPFGLHDIKATCVDTQFQKMTFAPCQESLLTKFIGNPGTAALVSDLISRAQVLAGSINDQVGREMSIQQIKEKLQGGGGPGTPGGTTSPVDAAVTGEIDGIVDDLLDS